MNNVTSLPDGLALLKGMLARSFDLVVAQLSDATRALLEHDETLATQVRRRDNNVDELEIQIDRLCEGLFEAYQPNASDTRKIVTSIKINTDLERIGDYSANMAKYIPSLRTIPVEIIAQAGVETLAMAVDRVMWETRSAFLSEDPDAAKNLLPLDVEVNRLYRKTFDAVIALFEEQPHLAPHLAVLLIAIKSLERLSDHLMNIAESVVFRAAGDDIRHARTRAKPY